MARVWAIIQVEAWRNSAKDQVWVVNQVEAWRNSVVAEVLVVIQVSTWKSCGLLDRVGVMMSQVGNYY